jgi:D-alanine--poly(phosphoribitol) ligase subunit 2
MSVELDTIRRTVERYLKRKPKAFDDATALVSGGLIDSMSIVDLILDLESAVGVRIPASEVQPDDFDSVQIIARTIERFR